MTVLEQQIKPYHVCRIVEGLKKKCGQLKKAALQPLPGTYDGQNEGVEDQKIPPVAGKGWTQRQHRPSSHGRTTAGSEQRSYRTSYHPQAPLDLQLYIYLSIYIYIYKTIEALLFLLLLNPSVANTAG